MNSYAEIFPIEIEGWCAGIQSFPGELSALTVKRVVLQLQPSFYKAIRSGIRVDIVSIARQFTIAARGIVSVREVAEWVILALPAPEYMVEDELYLLAEIIGAAEPSIEGLMELYNVTNAENSRKAA
jgi:hypothetical protein